MSSGNVNSYLPVPHISETMFQYTTRQPHSFRSRPPKLQLKYDAHTSFNRSILNNSLSGPHAISFKENSYEGNNSGIISNNDNQFISSMYNKDSKESYFDQCFETIAKIGEGSFGEVFKVRSKEDGLLYAIKKSKKLFRSGSYRQERLEEVKRYEEFSGHEHCIKLYKAWEEDDRLYMQMELCQNNLGYYLTEKGYIAEVKVWSILLDLLLALKSLHDRNLIHLDIKLENILIGEDGYCKLGDFGLVVDVDRANSQYTTEGDSRYIAKEIMYGKFSKAADIFSLGIAILELSCNLELPPNGPLWQELRNGVLPSKFITKISPELQNVIKSMMDPDPIKRPTVDQLLQHKQLITLLQRRKRWVILRKVANSYRRASRFMWTKMCNLKNFFNYFIVAFITIFKPKPRIELKVDLDESNHLNNNQTNMQFHSTPLNHNSASLRRSKKYSNRGKCSPNLYSSSDELNLNEFEWRDIDLENTPQPLICKQLFISDDSD